MGVNNNSENTVTMSLDRYDGLCLRLMKLSKENRELKEKLAQKEERSDSTKIHPSILARPFDFNEIERKLGGDAKESMAVNLQLSPEQVEKITAECIAYADKLTERILADSTYDRNNTLCIFFPECTADIKHIVINGREEPVKGLERLALDVEAMVDRPRVTVERRK